MTLLSDALMWAFCWLAYRLVIWLPSERGGAIQRLWYWLLPYAGYYGFHERWMDWRWSRRPRRPEPSEGVPF